MKKITILGLVLGLVLSSFGQKNQITPYSTMSYLWTFQFKWYNDIGVVYERELTENILVNGGISFLNLLNDDLSMFTYRLGGTYHIIDTKKGLFAGLDFQRGVDIGAGNISGDNFSQDFNISYVILNAKLGYSIPIGPGALKPSIGIGQMNVVGWGISALYLPVNVCYGIWF